MMLVVNNITKRHVYSRTEVLAFGLHLLTIYWVLRKVIMPDGVSVLNIALGLLLIVATFSLFLGGGRRNQISSVKLYPAPKLLLWLLVLWFLVTVVRGFTTEHSRFITWAINPEVGALVWLSPLAILIGLNQKLFLSLLPVFYKHAVSGLLIALCVLLALLADIELENSVVGVARFLFYGVFFLLLSGWGTQRQKRILFICALAWLIVGIVIQSRTAVVMVGILTVYTLFITRSNRFTSMALRSFIFIVVAVLCAIIFLPSVLSTMSDEWFIDTRTFLFIELFNDMSLTELIIGRGALGTYYSPYFEMMARAGIEGGDSSTRQSVEVVYLQLILKSGVIGMVLYLLLPLVAVYRVLTGELSRFSFAVVVVILARLVEMTSSANAFFSLNNLFFWMLVGVGLSCPRRRVIPL